MSMIDKFTKLFDKPVCDNCAGRQVAQLLTGFSNDLRGKMLRHLIAIRLDSGEKLELDMSNFSDFKFRNKEVKTKKHEKCYYCGDFFQSIDRTVDRILKNVDDIEFNTFLVGTKISKKMLDREEELWEKVGINYCEPIRAEINREVGKKLERALKKKADLKKPEVTILINFENDKIEVTINPVFIFGYYQKIKRGIPQSRWGTPGKYKTSVQEEIGKPFLKFCRDHKFHGAGREDIDALCLAQRPFVLELTQSKKRKFNIKNMMREVNKSKKVKVKGLKICDMDTVRKVKSLRSDKTYRALVKLNKPIKRKDLIILKKLKGDIKQRTPKRVKHRRADLTRKRRVKSVKIKFKNSKSFELIVEGTAGLYIKELISGDNGRTKPSVSELLNRKAVCKELDVIKIQKTFK